MAQLVGLQRAETHLVSILTEAAPEAEARLKAKILSDDTPGKSERRCGGPKSACTVPDTIAGDGRYPLNCAKASTVSHVDYVDLSGEPIVRYFVVENAGHIMPSNKYVLGGAAALVLGGQNRDVEGYELAWQFMKVHKR